MELTCQELAELITDYLEESLSPEERLRFEEHLAECGNCTRYMNQMRQTMKMTGKLLDYVVQPSEKQKLLMAFEDWKKSR